MKQNIYTKIMISSVCIFSLSCTSVQPVSSGYVHDKAIHKISVLSDTHLQTGNLSDGISYINAWNHEIIEAALDQIDANGYSDRFAVSGKKMFKVGVVFSSEGKGMVGWKVK